jgi:hypothetical protein
LQRFVQTAEPSLSVCFDWRVFEMPENFSRALCGFGDLTSEHQAKSRRKQL